MKKAPPSRPRPGGEFGSASSAPQSSGVMSQAPSGSAAWQRGQNPRHVAARLWVRLWVRLSASLAGLSPETIALIFALGLVLGVFPVFGAPTLLCGLAAIAFRLNLAAIQLVNQACSPLQYALLIPLGRAGAHIISVGRTGAANGPLLWKLADAARNAVVGWCCYCVPLGVLLYLILSFALRRRGRACFNRLESQAR